MTVIYILHVLKLKPWLSSYTVSKSFPLRYSHCFTNTSTHSRSAMSNPNGLLSQKLYHYLDQGRTLNDILFRAARGMAYFDLSKLNLT